MSTKQSIVYGEGFHLYFDVMDSLAQNDDVCPMYLTIENCGVELIAHPDGNTVTTTIPRRIAQAIGITGSQPRTSEESLERSWREVDPRWPPGRAWIKWGALSAPSHVGIPSTTSSASIRGSVMRDDIGAVMLTAAQVRSLLRAKITVLCDRSQKRLATSIGVSQQFVSDVLTGRREPTGKILKYLGYERVVSYRRLRS